MEGAVFLTIFVLCGRDTILHNVYLISFPREQHPHLRPLADPLPRVGVWLSGLGRSGIRTPIRISIRIWGVVMATLGIDSMI